MVTPLPVDLIRTARLIIESVSRNIDEGGSPIHSALLASYLYDAIRTELAETPRQHGARVGQLSAALDQCRNASLQLDRPEFMRAVLWSTYDILKGGAAELEANASEVQPNSSRPRPQLRLIIGGLSDQAGARDAESAVRG